jgi:hypothetical protein
MTSPVFCGSCDNECASGACINGFCASCEDIGLGSCPGGMVTYCTDLSTDAYNCGECHVSCNSGVCSNGACISTVACAEGLTECQGRCVDFSSDHANCGECGRECYGGDQESGPCVDGICILCSDLGQSLCNAATDRYDPYCANLIDDPANCGACGNACDSGICSEGVCSSAPTEERANEEQGASAAQEAEPESGGRIAAIYSGSCDQLGDLQADLPNIVDPQGCPVGQASAIEAATTSTTVGISLDVLIDQEHAVVVLESNTPDADVIACGDIGGIDDVDGELVIGSRELDKSEFTGIAYFAYNATNGSKRTYQSSLPRV